MEKFDQLTPITPDFDVVTEDLEIDYPTRSIYIENTGEEPGLVNGKQLQAGRSLNFFAGENGYYKAGVFSLAVKVSEEATPTEFTIIINK